MNSVLQKLFRRFSGQPVEKREFTIFRELFQARLERRGPLKSTGQDGRRVGVLVTPWLSTPVPFFSIECALMLAEAGCKVTLLWDGSDVLFNAYKKREVEEISRILERVPQGLDVVDVAQAPARGDVDAAHLDWLLRENVVRKIGGESGAREFMEDDSGRFAAVLEHGRKAAQAVETGNFDWLLIPGGVWGVSGIYVHIAQRQSKSFTTYDCGPGELVLAHEGISAHFGDFSAVFEAVRKRCRERSHERDHLIECAQQKLRQRMEGKDLYRLQLQPSSAETSYRCDILVPLNFRLDTAALLRQKLFASVGDWLRGILEWLETKPGVTL